MKIGKIFIGLDFILILSLLYIIDTEKVLHLALAAAIIHELGHIAAIKLCGGKIDTVCLRAFGAQINMKLYPMLSYKREIIIALAGPFAGAIFGVLSSFWGNYTIAGFSLVLTVFNLIPALPLDGGRAIKFAALLLSDESWQRGISKTLNTISAVFVVLLGICINLKFGIAPSLLIFCTFTATNFLKELF